MIIIKLGGSVITDKKRENRARKKVIDRLVQEIKRSKKKIILVHGAGSFGHIHAKEYKLDRGFKSSDQLKGFHITHSSVRILNQIVMNSLYNHGMFSVSLPPISFVEMSNRKLKYIDLRCFEESISIGLTPVTFGDVVFDDKLGFSICSGDVLVLNLSRYFKPEKVILVIDEDGIFDKDPKRCKDAKLLREIKYDDLPTAEKSLYTDVTGGMGGKIEVMREIAKENIDVLVVNGNKRDRLFGSLIGKKVKGTLVIGG